MSCKRIIIAAVAAVLSIGLARAQDTQPGGAPAQNDESQSAPAPNSANDAFNAMIGAWEFSNADHDKICHFNFKPDAVPQGHRVEIDKNCSSLFPSTKSIVAWAVDNYGGLRLLDEHSEAVVELTLVEGGMYDGFKPDEGRYILQAAAAVQTRSADDMIGDWTIARGTGKPICALTLTNTAVASGSDNLALKIKPGCDPLVTRFGPTSWHMDNGDLVLSSPRGQTWRFEENDGDTWQRIPESADPVLLVRQ